MPKIYDDREIISEHSSSAAAIDILSGTGFKLQNRLSVADILGSTENNLSGLFGI
jgi:hypothetical protein